MHEEKLSKVIPQMVKGALLVTALKAPKKSTLILTDEFEYSNIQRIISVGPYAKNDFSEGEWVEINFNNFIKPRRSEKKLKNGDSLNEGVYEFSIPARTVGGDTFFMIDQSDVTCKWPADAI